MLATEIITSSPLPPRIPSSCVGQDLDSGGLRRDYSDLQVAAGWRGTGIELGTGVLPVCGLCQLAEPLHRDASAQGSAGQILERSALRHPRFCITPPCC